MYISRKLNNNVVVARDDLEQEVIVMGKGIAFQRKVGEEIPAELIDKVYTLSDPDVSNKFQELVSSIPLEYMNLSDEIISYAKTNLGKRINEIIYISLTDHIFMSIERFLNGVVVKNALLWDIKRFYKDEFAVGMKALDLIEEQFKVRLPEDEAGFIALHVVNAQLDEDIPVVYDITKVMQEISNIVKYHFSISFDEDSVYYYRFITHLKFFAQRLFNQQELDNHTEDEFLTIIREKYSEAFICVQIIKDFIEKKYDYLLSGEEQLYLTIHVAKIVNETRMKQAKNTD